MAHDPLFDKAMTAIQAQRHDEARALLAQLVAANPRHEEGWLWLAGVVDNLDQSIDCLERVLKLNPANAKAKEWLTFARKEREQEAAQGLPLGNDHGDRGIERLGRYLIEYNFVTVEQLERALIAQRLAQKSGVTKRLGTILVEQGAITEERLKLALSKQFQDFNEQFKD